MSKQGRKPETVTVKADCPWFRVHPYTFGAAQYNLSTKGDSRFSPHFIGPGPDTVVGALYTGEEEYAAFCETIFRNILDSPDSPQVLRTGEFRDKSISQIQPKQDLNLLDLRDVGDWPEAQKAVTTTDYAVSRDFGRRLMAENDKVHGFIWYSRLAPNLEVCALFDHRFGQLDWSVIPPSIDWQGTYSLASDEGVCKVGKALQRLEDERGIIVDLIGPGAPGR